MAEYDVQMCSRVSVSHLRGGRPGLFRGNFHSVPVLGSNVVYATGCVGGSCRISWIIVILDLLWCVLSFVTWRCVLYIDFFPFLGALLMAMFACL